MTLRDLAKNRAEASRDWGISATKNQPSPIIEFEQISLRGYSSRFSCVPLFFQKWQCDSKFYLWLYFSLLCFAFLQGGKRFGYLLILSDAIWNSDLLRKIRWSIAIFQKKKKKKCGFPSLVICRAQTLVVGLFLPYFLFPPLSCVIASFTQFPPFFFFFFLKLPTLASYFFIGFASPNNQTNHIFYLPLLFLSLHLRLHCQQLDLLLHIFIYFLVRSHCSFPFRDFLPPFAFLDIPFQLHQKMQGDSFSLFFLNFLFLFALILFFKISLHWASTFCWWDPFLFSPLSLNRQAESPANQVFSFEYFLFFSPSFSDWDQFRQSFLSFFVVVFHFSIFSIFSSKILMCNLSFLWGFMLYQHEKANGCD